MKTKGLCGRLRSISGKISLLLVTMLIAYAPAVDAASTVKMYLSPASGSVVAGNNLSVQIRVSDSGNPNVDAVEADLLFPANLLAVGSISASGSNYNQNNSLTSSYSNATGNLQVKGHNTALKGTGDYLVANVTFVAKSSGSATVTIASSSKVGTLSGTNNVGVNKLNSTSGGSYEITPAPAVTTTPVPTASKPATTSPPATTVGSTPNSTATNTTTSTPTNETTPSGSTTSTTHKSSSSQPVQQENSSNKSTRGIGPTKVVLPGAGIIIAIIIAILLISAARHRRATAGHVAHQPDSGWQPAGTMVQPDASEDAIQTGALPSEPIMSMDVTPPEPVTLANPLPEAVPITEAEPALTPPEVVQTLAPENEPVTEVEPIVQPVINPLPPEPAMPMTPPATIPEVQQPDITTPASNVAPPPSPSTPVVPIVGQDVTPASPADVILPQSAATPQTHASLTDIVAPSLTSPAAAYDDVPDMFDIGAQRLDQVAAQQNTVKR